MYIYRNELHKACFPHDMAYGDFKDLSRRASLDNILRDKAFDIAKSLKYNEYQRGLASMVYKIFDKKTASLLDKYTIGGSIKNEIKLNEQLAEELHKPIIKIFETSSEFII